MGWWDTLRGRRAPDESPTPEPPAAPTAEQILDSVAAVQQRVSGRAPAAVTARVARIATEVTQMVPRLDRFALGSRQAYTVVATATSYLPEAVDAYLRLPRDFADGAVVAKGKTSLMLLCDQLDLLAVTLTRISDALSRQDAAALVAHGQFLAETFAESGLSLHGDTL